ncbi:hypothetical protein EIP91_009967 [Steccherinum ochraceum]|uniref:Uncharacterized protein n=1 Tax=Steccherinum ochraceum TaxID=92696 RepID=A0A4R0R116_9APHY|nr:hypothetical protein EIP91_009967 [Steccherinum ochraceum]
MTAYTNTNTRGEAADALSDRKLASLDLNVDVQRGDPPNVNLEVGGTRITGQGPGRIRVARNGHLVQRIDVASSGDLRVRFFGSGGRRNRNTHPWDDIPNPPLPGSDIEVEGQALRSRAGESVDTGVAGESARHPEATTPRAGTPDSLPDLVPVSPFEDTPSPPRSPSPVVSDDEQLVSGSAPPGIYSRFALGGGVNPFPRERLTRINGAAYSPPPTPPLSFNPADLAIAEEGRTPTQQGFGGGVHARTASSFKLNPEAAPFIPRGSSTASTVDTGTQTQVSDGKTAVADEKVTTSNEKSKDADAKAANEKFAAQHRDFVAQGAQYVGFPFDLPDRLLRDLQEFRMQRIEERNRAFSDLIAHGKEVDEDGNAVIHGPACPLFDPDVWVATGHALPEEYRDSTASSDAAARSRSRSPSARPYVNPGRRSPSSDPGHLSDSLASDSGFERHPGISYECTGCVLHVHARTLPVLGSAPQAETVLLPRLEGLSLGQRVIARIKSICGVGQRQ